MQTEIWKNFSALEPHAVTVDWAQQCIPAPKDGNRMPALYQINQDTRRGTLKRYGYVMLKYPIIDQKVLFHPEMDLLYITESTAFMWAPSMAIPRSLMASLGVCGALSRIRSVALPMHIIKLTLYMEAFGKCANLELILGVWKYKQTTDGGTVAAFCFEDAEIAGTEYNRSLDIDEREFQSMIARDRGVTPFWMEVNRTQLFGESETVADEDYDRDSERESDNSSENGDL
jgi:hypothetical protein